MKLISDTIKYSLHDGVMDIVVKKYGPYRHIVYAHITHSMQAYLHYIINALRYYEEEYNPVV